MTPDARLLLRWVIKLCDHRARRGIPGEAAVARNARDTLLHARPDAREVMKRIKF